MLRWASVAVLSTLAALAATLAVGSWRWQRDGLREIERLTASATSPGAAVDPDALDGLPPPVARYLRSVLRPGQARIRQASFRQSGTLRADPGDEAWWPFTARQVVVPPAPGFVWQASVRTAPWLRVAVLDAYVAGQGRGRAALWSTVTVANEKGSPALDSAALVRYLAEAAWYPTALLPGQGLKWRPLDASNALASLTNGTTTVELEFRFAANGDLASVFSPGRQRRIGSGYVLTPWRGRFDGYEEVAGMRIPHRAEVEWQIDAAWRAVWRGELADLDYTFAE